MAQIIGYMLHDAVGNMEQPVEDYSPSALERLEADGIIFVAVYDDGSREIVKAAAVAEPEPQMNGVTLCTPKYVDDRTAATVAVFDALASIVDPEASATAADETGEAAGQADPVEAFKAALTALKALESKKEAEVG